MRKLVYRISYYNIDRPSYIEFITDRTPEWTEEQYIRNRIGCVMELISNETTEEQKPISREVRLG